MSKKIEPNEMARVIWNYTVWTGVRFGFQAERAEQTSSFEFKRILKFLREAIIGDDDAFINKYKQKN